MDDEPVAEAAHQIVRGKGNFWGGVRQNSLAVMVVGKAKYNLIYASTSKAVPFMKLINYLTVCSLLLTACAQTPQRVESEQPSTPPEQHAEVLPTLPNIELSDELLYELLLTEIASQRGHDALAAKGSVELARRTRDPRLAQRATQLAMETGDMQEAIAAFKLWQDVEPTSPYAARMLASILLRGGKLDEAGVEFAKVLKDNRMDAGRSFLQIYQMISSYPDRAAALQLVRKLAESLPELPEAHWSVAHMAHMAGDHALALSEVHRASALRSDWLMAVSLEAQILQKDAPQQSLDVLSGYLAKQPKAWEIRLQYARALLEQKQYQQARNEFQRLADDNPNLPDVTFTIALISLQMNDFENAEKMLNEALSKGGKGQDTIHYYLGQLGEAMQKEGEATAHYRQVQGGEYQFSAQARIAYLLSKQGKLDEAISYLHQIVAVENHQRVQLLLIEAQLLREAKQDEAAYRVLQQGLVKLPNHPELLFAAGMLADKIGKPAEFEQMMRKVIQLQPDHAHAYNALGYGLLERNERISEAVELVEKALQLAPNDPAIMDSVGWGYYRSGRLEESERLLRRAFAGSQDFEIAMHLGEVLWMRGAKAEAEKVWRDSLKTNPDNIQLQTLIKKFIP